MTLSYHLQPATPADKPFLRHLFRDVRALEFQPLNLPEPALTQLLDLQFLAQETSYAQQFPALETNIIWIGPYAVGRVLVSQEASELRLVDIGLLSQFRGQGVGRAILESLCQRASTTRLPLRLSVRTDNPARRLYARLGFVQREVDSFDAEMEWGGTPAAAPAPVGVSAPGLSIVAGSNAAYFSSLRGTEAIVERAPADNTALALTSVEPLAPDKNPNVSMGDSFRLTFQGAASSLLPQGVYPLLFHDGHREEVFLVPIKADSSVAVYESIYNRMTFTGPSK